jgi:outer membrane protein assembly factor BamA
MKSAVYRFLLIAVLFTPFFAKGQFMRKVQNLADTLLYADRKIFGAPFLGYTPETGWQGGFGGFTFFRTASPEKDSLLRPSSVRFSASYSQFRQIAVWLPFELFFNENKWWFTGQLGYYRYPYFFYGIGREAAKSNLERYTPQFPRFRLDALRRWHSWYAGPRIWFQQVEMIQTEQGGLLSSGLVKGSDGGRNLGLGGVAILDKRNNIFWPVNSYYFTLETMWNRPAYSDFNYETYVANFRYYLGLKNNTHVIAMEQYTKWNRGEAPFNQLALVGGSARMRGYQEGRFRDNLMLSQQVEYRSPIFGKVGYAVFASAAFIGADWNNVVWQKPIPAMGAGLRYEVNRKENLRLRIDYARGENSQGWYLTIGEAF